MMQFGNLPIGPNLLLRASCERGSICSVPIYTELSGEAQRAESAQQSGQRSGREKPFSTQLDSLWDVKYTASGRPLTQSLPSTVYCVTGGQTAGEQDSKRDVLQGCMGHRNGCQYSNRTVKLVNREHADKTSYC